MGHMGMIRGLMNYPATKQINNPTNIGSIFFFKYMDYYGIHMVMAIFMDAWM